MYEALGHEKRIFHDFDSFLRISYEVLSHENRISHPT